ncbi:MAG: pilus assembly protein, partial [Actinobacteria bacterium]|nr:pilus assembly protein [Actinomycetota bacterium]
MEKLNFKKLRCNRENQGSQAKQGKYSKQGSPGNVLIFTAILMPLFILLIGLVTDIGRALVYKEELNKACMIAAEEACKKIDID